MYFHKDILAYNTKHATPIIMYEFVHQLVLRSFTTNMHAYISLVNMYHRFKHRDKCFTCVNFFSLTGYTAEDKYPHFIDGETQDGRLICYSVNKW